MSWTKVTPKGNGVYWMRYQDRQGKQVLCAAEVLRYKDSVLVKTTHGDTFFEKKDDEMPGLKQATPKSYRENQHSLLPRKTFPTSQTGV